MSKQNNPPTRGRGVHNYNHHQVLQKIEKLENIVCELDTELTNLTKMVNVLHEKEEYRRRVKATDMLLTDYDEELRRHVDFVKERKEMEEEWKIYVPERLKYFNKVTGSDYTVPEFIKLLNESTTEANVEVVD